MISSKYRHILSSMAAASPGTASVRSKKKGSYDAILLSLFKMEVDLELLLFVKPGKKPNTNKNLEAL